MQPGRDRGLVPGLRTGEGGGQLHGIAWRSMAWIHRIGTTKRRGNTGPYSEEREELGETDRGTHIHTQRGRDNERTSPKTANLFFPDRSVESASSPTPRKDLTEVRRESGNWPRWLMRQRMDQWREDGRPGQFRSGQSPVIRRPPPPRRPRRSRPVGLSASLTEPHRHTE